MTNVEIHQTRTRFEQGHSQSIKPSYTDLEDELINLYPQVDLMNSQIAELKCTIASMCDSSVIRGERDYQRALDTFNEKLHLTQLTRLSVIALEAAKTIATLRNDTEKALLIEHASVSAKIINDHLHRSELNE